MFTFCILDKSFRLYLSAQRLPASEACSLFAYWTNHSGSTSVLNAFRHQRHVHSKRYVVDRMEAMECSTPSGIRGMFTEEIYTPHHKKQSAQRLPASEACSLHYGKRSNIYLHVLNAFRHQRHVHMKIRKICIWHIMCSTPSGIRGMFTLLVVYIYQLSGVCSTPSGIRGMFTCHVLVLLSPGYTVLNAFRHQRHVHPGNLFHFANTILCSTPSGIRGMFTL